VVYTASRGYDDPSERYPARENLQGVEVRRLPLSSFGKSSFLTRGLGSASLGLQCLARTLAEPDLGAVVITTSPPLSDLAGTVAGLVRRRVPIVYWAMDLYAEQVVALGRMKPTDPAARALQLVQRIILRRATRIIALDRFMAARLESRAPVSHKLVVIPPWSHENRMAPPEPGENPFRLQHGLSGKFLVMYSGNHTYTHPLTTVLEAAAHFCDDPVIRFLFVGGGAAKKQVDDAIARHGLRGTLSLPYHPLSEIGHSLSAADLHVVTLGDPMVGICHPSKIYGAMAVGRPVLYVGPRPSHVTDLLEGRDFGWQVAHGDTARAVAAIDAARRVAPETLRDMGERGRGVVRSDLSQARLCGRVCEEIDGVIGVRREDREE
jgi:colanic acid biosynthesis glycosyl transferase WcaI